MAESLVLSPNATREETYTMLLPQIKALVEGESDLIANLANICAVLKEAFGFFWVGFYLVKEDQLVLGPFQGPIACTRIPFHKGVCGHCYQIKQSVLVPDVEAFPGHIACSSASKSEVVLPIFDKNGDVWAVLDVDSDHLNDFSEVDLKGLEAIMRVVDPMNDSQCLQ